MKSQQKTLFMQNTLDRMDQLRGSIDKVIEELASIKAVFIFVSDDKLLLQDDQKNYFFSYEQMQSRGISNEYLVFLGCHDSTYYFAKALDISIEHPYKQMDLRSYALAHIDAEEDIGVLAQAFSVLKWHQTHLYCSNCGSKTKMTHAGWRRECSQCAKEHFPRVDPVVIMLVTYGEHCLLGSGIHFQENRYSCLAGFMEPGETIESAARRELFEEAGVVGLGVQYICSQPWPFPFNLMIGLHVQAQDQHLVIDHHELRDARWFSKADVRAMLAGAEDDRFTLPPKIAIARTLLEYWASL